MKIKEWTCISGDTAGIEGLMLETGRKGVEIWGDEFEHMAQNRMHTVH
jgi:hypothetical protein